MCAPPRAPPPESTRPMLGRAAACWARLGGAGRTRSRQRTRLIATGERRAKGMSRIVPSTALPCKTRRAENGSEVGAHRACELLALLVERIADEAGAELLQPGLLGVVGGGPDDREARVELARRAAHLHLLGERQVGQQQ